MDDYLTKSGVEALDLMIRLYWKQRGYDAGTRIETDGVCNRDRIMYVVRSNMVNGRPR